jgi:uncharacterized protein YkwD
VTPVPVSRRHFVLGAASAAALAALASCSTTTVLAPDDTAAVADLTAAALPLVNAERRRRGKPALDADPVATAAARDQAIRMARYGRMRHDLGEDRDFLARMKRMEVQLPAAENIATGQDSVEDAVAAWVRSKKHLENMLGSYRGLGVVVARNPGTADRPFWAMVLSSPDRGWL